MTSQLQQNSIPNPGNIDFIFAQWEEMKMPQA